MFNSAFLLMWHKHLWKKKNMQQLFFYMKRHLQKTNDMEDYRLQEGKKDKFKMNGHFETTE